MEDIIINGYIVLWVAILIVSWIPIAFLSIEIDYEYDEYKKRLLSIIRAANIVIVCLIIVTLPLQIALITELWRG